MKQNVRLALDLSYLGGGFCGWQRQARGRSVQGVLETALTRLYAQPVTAHGAGRTDAGVHAAGQVAHVDVPDRIPPGGLRSALNSLLPDDLRVLAVRATGAGFHARVSAIGKRYRYRLAWGPPLPPWDALRRWSLPGRPDLSALEACLGCIRGTHDFAAFALSGHSGHGRRGTMRTVARADLGHRGRQADLVLEGDGFLRGMVRRLTGALWEVARGARDRAWIEGLLAGTIAAPPAPTAPAHGLTLERVFYPPAIIGSRARLSRP
ncbi:MAG TPA: tRNA pseudouridine(38-40) synthase TruA [Thermoanaerobaculaceae bacterium]|nr:tRNA pseudouridine(38-40) synthase TruA [Thermoanaerobaculaceae bacterium]HPS77555.1 tRNA pseudouridine(38-40) synthase TruA [Thermoanaerobaculaceae bacterium]